MNKASEVKMESKMNKKPTVLFTHDGEKVVVTKISNFPSAHGIRTRLGVQFLKEYCGGKPFVLQADKVLFLCLDPSKDEVFAIEEGKSYRKVVFETVMVNVGTALERYREMKKTKNNRSSVCRVTF